MNLRLRCENCNLQEYTVIKQQPDGHGMFKNFLKKRKYVHCIACGHIEDMDNYTRRMMGI